MRTETSTGDIAARKRELRREMRILRRAIPLPEQRRAAAAVLRRAVAARLVVPGRRIAFFLPNDGEIDLFPLLNRALWLRAACFLPVLPVQGKLRLFFGRIGKSTSWRINRFGILEPSEPRPARARDLQLIFVPLVAFDDDGFRVGMGGGFYDATLAFLRQRRIWRRPRTIGVAYDLQRVAEVPRDPWDMPLTDVLTPRGLHRVRR